MRTNGVVVLQPSQMAMMFLQQLMTNPEGANDMMKALTPFIEQSQSQKGKPRKGSS